MSLVTSLIVVVHILVSILLVALILLHAGRGGGLSDMFGGGMGTPFGGSTVVERNLDRYTVVIALVWGATTFALALLIA